MSSYRCGLQVSRSTIITNDSWNCPREKLMSCLINKDMLNGKESVLSDTAVTDEVIETLEAEKDAKTIIQDIAEDSQEGKGLMEWIYDLPVTQKIIGTAKEKVKKTIYSKGKSFGENLLAKASNLFPSSDENAADIFPGEYHALVKLPNGKYGRANYSGPGTMIEKRLRRGDKPRVLSDKVSQAHDIRYALAQNEPDVRVADEKFVAKMKQLTREKLDSSFNIQPAMRTIQAKMKAEDFGLLSRDKFVNIDKPPTGSDKVMLNSKLGQLIQDGYGSRNMRGGYSVQSRGMRTGSDIRGVPQAGKWGKMTLSEKVKMPLLNTTEKFLNRNTKTTQRDIDIPSRRYNIRDNLKGGRNRIVGDVVSHPRLMKNRMQMRGGNQAPGMQASTASEYIDIGTRGKNKSVRASTAVEQRRMRGSGYRGSNIVNVGTLERLANQPTIQSQMRGEPHTGDVGEYLEGNGLSLPGSGKHKYPADKLLMKMKKKIKQKGTKRKPIYIDDREMSNFLAHKLAPMVMAY